MIGVILAAAGSGVRYGAGIPKQFLELDGVPLYQHSLQKLLPFADDLVLVLPPGWLSRVRGGLGQVGARVRVVAGGKSRQESVWLGLRELDPGVDVVLVHDAVRPFLSEALIESVLEGTRSAGACVPGLPPAETVKKVSREDRVQETISRDSLRLIQTPQGFRRDLLESALGEARERGFEGTDEAMLVERIGHPVLVVPGEPGNSKVTWPEDLRGRSGSFSVNPAGVHLRVGIGFDFHPFETGRKLFLGGLEIPSDQGLRGHSDADVLLHALCDSLLGAAGLRDIGHYFPDSDVRFLDIPSTELLIEVMKRISREGFQVSNVDLVLIAEFPRIRPFVDEIKSNLSRLLRIPTAAIGLKATTMEKKGTIGRGEGIAAQAVAMLHRTDG